MTGKLRQKTTAILLSVFLLTGAVMPGAMALEGRPLVQLRLNGSILVGDTPAYIDSNNRTMVPIRLVGESLGNVVDWNEQARTVRISRGDQVVGLTINSRQATVGGQVVTMDTEPVIVNNRTMVPLRFVMENLGARVIWDGATNTVDIWNQPRVERVVLTSDNVNLRQGAGTSFPRIETLPKNTRLTVVAQSGEWLEVRTESGKGGWVAGWLVQDLPVATPDPGGVPDGVTTGPEVKRVEVTENVNLRAGPATTFTRLALLPKGTAMTVIGAKGDWLEVRLEDGKQGWVAGWLVTEVVTANPPAVPPVLPEKETPSEHGEPLRLAVVNSSVVNVRSGPDISFPLVTQVRSGQFLPVIGEQGDWYQVQMAEGKTGWIAGWLVSIRTLSTAARGDGHGRDPVNRADPLAGKIIVIDPGHGSIQPGNWSDPGAVGKNGLYERDVVMDISLRLRDILISRGATVILTRVGDTTLTLEGRAAIANDAGADVFVSVHANASTSRLLNGTTTYYYAPVGSPLEGQRADRQLLASLVQMEMVQAMGRRDAGIFEASFSVLRNTTMPSILAETAFISNPEEEALLGDPVFRAQAALGIAEGLAKYFAIKAEH